MKLFSIITAIVYLVASGMAQSIECSERKNLRTKKCEVDEDCPQLRCVRAPCPTIVCHSGGCIMDTLLAELDVKNDGTPEPECKSRLECPQVRCALGYPCPEFDCVEGQCLDVSEGAFAPCTSDDQCFREGDACNDGKCEKLGLIEDEPISLCKEDRHCPQPTCLSGMICPKYVCTKRGCVIEQNHDVPCTKEAKQCPDGSFVVRTGPECEFETCPHVICTEDAKQCPDGSYVSRTGPNCEFEPCRPVLCTADVMQCPDGTYVPRGGPDCEFNPCPPYFKCFETADCPEISCKDGEPCNQFICNQDRGICMEVEASCCKDPEPSQMECGRSGCHCCGDGVWLLGNSGPTLTTAQACGMRGPSEPCEHAECREDGDCPVLNCITQPCPSMGCVDGQCVFKAS